MSYYSHKVKLLKLFIRDEETLLLIHFGHLELGVAVALSIVVVVDLDQRHVFQKVDGTNIDTGDLQSCAAFEVMSAMPSG